LLLWLGVPAVACGPRAGSAVFAGPLRWAVAGIAIGGVAASGWRWRVPSVRVRPGVAFRVTFLVYAVAGVRP
jgi:hypothetical protein